MDSQTGISETLYKLSCLSAEDVIGELDDLLPQLINCLESCNEHPSTAVKVACALFGQCLPNLRDLHIVETQVLKPALPAVHRIVTEVFQLIKSRLKDDNDEGLLDVLQSLLQVCISLLESMEHCLNFLKMQGKIEISSAKIFVTNFDPIILEVLRHCDESQEIYGLYITQLSEYLGTFFRKSNDLVLKYIEIIKDVFVFNCAYAGQLDILCEILVFLSQVGRLSSSLGVRAMSETWKLYATLTTNHTSDLCGRLDMADPLSALATKISTILLEVTQQGVEEKLCERNLKVANFLLRVTVKLCEQFTGMLGDCYAALLNLLLSLHRHSEFGYELHAAQSPSPLLDQILIVGADPLLSKLIADQQFSTEVMFAERGQSHLLLLLSISQQLVPLTPETRKLWLSSEDFYNNIFYLMFSSAKYCQVGNEDASDESLGSCNMKVYKKLLVVCTSLIAVLSSEEILALENALLKSISNPQASCCQSLFACDIWVILVKLAGSSFCLHHIEHLMALVKPLPQGKQRLMLLSLIRRLLSIMPSKQRPIIQDIIELKTDSSEDATLALEVLHLFINTPPSISSFKNMLNVLDTISMDGYDNVQFLIPHIIELWNFSDETYLGSCISRKLLNASCMLISDLNNLQFKNIISKFFNFTNPSLKLQSIIFLTNLSNIKFSANKDQQDVFDLIANIYAFFLQDCNDIVQRSALQSFSEFSHVTSHEIIVTQTVSGSKDLQKIVSSYFQTQIGNMDKLVLNKQLIELSMKEFACECDDQIGVHTNVVEVVNDDLCSDFTAEVASSKKLKTGDQEDVRNISKLFADFDSNLDSIKELNDKSLLSSENMMELRRSLDKLNDICNHLH